MQMLGRGARNMNTDLGTVIIQADQATDHGVFSDLWSEIKNAGANKISVSTLRRS